MHYKSTRNSSLRLEASQVIAKGISDEGGLFLPVSIPSVVSELEALSGMNYNTLAKKILSLYLTDFTKEEIECCVDAAYTKSKFEDVNPVQIKKLNATASFLELWHGPTCAFKDMALQILPHLLTVSLKKQKQDQKALILVATSGDTGKAALEGFKDVENTEVVVFYPENGVSPMQKLQMATQEGKNVGVCAVKGNFDDTQTGIKEIFTNDEIKKTLYEAGYSFSSANSINWGRLLPQIVYYFYAYFELYRNGEIKALGDKVNFVVPTGNFGNILAAYYAMQMGLPVNKLICASNANRVLTDFISTGTYDKKRDFYLTASPSMDILVSSNLERLLYLLSGEDSEKLSSWMTALGEKGEYTVDEDTIAGVKSIFYGNYCDDSETEDVIKTVFENENYLADTHTAVAIGVYNKYISETNDNTPTVIASTASPYKFVKDVLSSIDNQVIDDEFDMVTRLEQLTGLQPQAQIIDLKNKAVRFDTVIEKSEMQNYVLSLFSPAKDDL